MLFFRSTTVSLFLCRVRTAQSYVLGNHKRGRFRLTQLRTSHWAEQEWHAFVTSYYFNIR